MPTPGPRLGHVQPPTVVPAGTLVERCDAPADLFFHCTSARAISKAKVGFARPRPHFTTMRSRFRSQTPLPTPSTLRISSAFLKGPWLSRYSTIFSATLRPTPVSVINDLTSAVLTVIFPVLASWDFSGATTRVFSDDSWGAATREGGADRNGGFSARSDATGGETQSSTSARHAGG